MVAVLESLSGCAMTRHIRICEGFTRGERTEGPRTKFLSPARPTMWIICCNVYVNPTIAPQSSAQSLPNEDGQEFL